jgi:hypothetical protein
MTLQSLGRFAQTSKCSQELADDPFVWRKRWGDWVSIDSDLAKECIQGMIDEPKITINRIVCVWNFFLKIIDKPNTKPLYIKNKKLYYEHENDCAFCVNSHTETNLEQLPPVIPLSWLETYDMLVMDAPEDRVPQNIYDRYGNDFWIPNYDHFPNYQFVYPNMIEQLMNVRQIVNPWHAFIGDANGAMNRRAERHKRRLEERAERQRTTHIPSYLVQTYPTKKEAKKQMKKFAPKKLKMQNKRINLNSNRHKQKYR